MQNRAQIPKFKLLLIGPSGVGKTSLLNKFITNKFSYDYQVTTGVQFYSREVQFNQKTSIQLQLWDTMGQQAFKSIVKSHYKNVAAIMFLYSIDKHQNLDKLAMWVRQVKDNVPQQAVFFLIGTKLDLQDVRKVTKQEGQAYSKSIKATLFEEVSSKTGEKIKQLFDKIAKILHKKYQSSKPFKEMVKQANIIRAESFRLRREDGVRSQEVKKKSCC